MQFMQMQYGSLAKPLVSNYRGSIGMDLTTDELLNICQEKADGFNKLEMYPWIDSIQSQRVSFFIDECLMLAIHLHLLGN